MRDEQAQAANLALFSAGVAGFAGAYTEPASGLIYLTNRYYDPTTAQFISVDPLVGLTQIPYGYAGDDPIDNTDPAVRAYMEWAVSVVMSYTPEAPPVAAQLPVPRWSWNDLQH